MSEVTLKLDNNANEIIDFCKCHFGSRDEAEVLKKGLAILKILAYVDSTKGEIFVRKGDHETKINIR